MDLNPTEEQLAIREALHEFSENEIRPHAREAEEAGQVPERIEKQLLEMGVAAPVPEEFGGQGTFDTVTSVQIAEEVAWGDPGIAYAVLGAGLAATVVDVAGTDQQRAELLPKFLTGTRGALALAERDAGADFTAIESELKDGKLSATKYAVPYMDGDNLLLVVARDSEGPAIFIVDRESAEASVEDKLGLRSARTAKLVFDRAEATKLGDGDAETVTFALLRAKLMNAAIGLGLARAAHEYSVKYAQERTAFGRPIGAFQAISFKVADRAMDLETARLLVWKAAWAVDGKRDDAHKQVMGACGHAVAAAVANADDGVQILGGHGYMRDHPEELWYRDALTLATFDSPSMVGDLFLSQEFKAVNR